MENNIQTSDFLISNIVSDYKANFSTKQDVFGFLIRLKKSVEFNATIDWKQLYRQLSEIYKDKNPYYTSNKFTPDPIDKKDMTDSDIFVFGSNTEGKHIGGAAKVAVEQYGAILGQATGLQGNSYAIQTIDYTKNITIDLVSIEKEIDSLIDYALDNSDKTFWVTKIGTGISKYNIKDIADLFVGKIIPENVILPIEFVNINLHEKYLYSTTEDAYFYIKSDTEIIKSDKNGIRKLPYNKDIFYHSYSNLIVSTEAEFVSSSQQVLMKLF